MKKEIVVNSLNIDFKGEFKLNNQLFTIPGVINGEKVLVEVDDNPRFKKAKLLKIITPSKNRVNPICPIFNKCGGCSLQHIKYQEQLVLKTKWMNDLFYNKFKKNFNIPLVLGMKDPKHYRNKNQMVIKKDKNKIKLYFKDKEDFAKEVTFEL